MRKLLLIAPGLSLAKPLPVFAGTVPVRSFVQKIGRHYVDALAMVWSGFDSHTCDPSPQRINALTGAVINVRTGISFKDA